MLDFIKPTPSPLLIASAKVFWPAYLRLFFGPVDILIDKKFKEIFAKLKYHGVIICPNHPALPDPETMFAASAIISEHFYFLTAREVFGKKDSWKSKWYQKLGCYSIERGAADIGAFRTTKRLLKRKKKIVIFPEGEVSFQNDFVMPIENGPEHIALATLKEMRETGLAGNISILPVAVKYRLKGDVRTHIKSALKKIESVLAIRHAKNQPAEIRLSQCFDIAVGRLEIDNQCPSIDKLDWNKRLGLLREKIILSAEEFAGINFSNALPQSYRLHLLRSYYFEKNLQDHKYNKDIHYHYKQLLIATALLAIGNHSFHSQMTQEETVELINILSRQIMNKQILRLPQTVTIEAAGIIDVEKYLPSYIENKKTAIESLKDELSKKLNSKLTELTNGYAPIFME